MALTSFTGRITGLFALLVTATTAAVLLVGGLLVSERVMTGIDALNAAEFREIRDRLGPSPGTDAATIAQLIRPHSEIDAGLYFFQVSTAPDTLLFRSANLGRERLPAFARGDENRTVRVGRLGRVRLSDYRLGVLQVQIASPLESVDRVLATHARTSLFLLGGVALASVGLGWSFARLVLRPVRAIRETASHIGADNLGERIPVPAGRDELAALATLLNQMLGRLEASFHQVKRFTSDASHELKTLLALVRLNAEELRPRVAGDAEACERLDDLLEDVDRMHRIIESLLFLAKADSGGLVPHRGEIATAEFVRTFAEDAVVLAEDRAVQFAVSRSDDGRTAGDATLLWQLLLNLVCNACQAAGAEGHVTLESAVEGGTWRLAVLDDGPGLPPDQLEAAFERFVRFSLPGAPSGTTVGHGLGLAICRSIATLHGGRIRAENRADRRGLRVVVELPITPASSA